MLAHLSGDPNLSEAFRLNEDIHDRTALKVFGEHSGLSAHELRRRAKIINYALLYGKTAFTLSRDIGVTTEAAKEFIAAYFAGFPAVRAYLDGTIAEAKAKGFVSTLYGRRRSVPDILSRNGMLRSAAERVAVNMPIQGTAADILKRAMIDLHAAFAPIARSRPHDPHRPRRAADRSARGRRRRGRRDRARRRWKARPAQRAADGRRRHRRELEGRESLRPMRERILVVGATGHIGRPVLDQLAATGARVRVLNRRRPPAVPAGVEVVAGDLTQPDTLDAALDGIDAVFLVWTAPPAAVDAALDRIAIRGRRVVLLTSPHKTPHPLFQQPNPMRGLHARIESLIDASGAQWTFLRPGMFAINAVSWWGPQIRSGDAVRWPCMDAPTAPIHEGDVARVAVRALTEDGHAGAEYVLTGPQSLTQAEQVRVVGEAIGRPAAAGRHLTRRGATGAGAAVSARRHEHAPRCVDRGDRSARLRDADLRGDHGCAAPHLPRMGGGPRRRFPGSAAGSGSHLGGAALRAWPTAP